MITKLSQFYKIIGYSFKDDAILNRALTHRSKSRKNYERLEFLGDSILGFVIAEELYDRFPNLDEGKLSQIRSKLVKGETLAKLALKLKINEFVILGVSEKNGGQSNEKILEDALEAVIAGIYLDSDFTSVRKVILAWYSDVISNLNLDFIDIKDNKSRLQEILLQNSMSLPKYTVVSIEGKDHEQVFYYFGIIKRIKHLHHC